MESAGRGKLRESLLMQTEWEESQLSLYVGEDVVRTDFWLMEDVQMGGCSLADCSSGNINTYSFKTIS